MLLPQRLPLVPLHDIFCLLLVTFVDKPNLKTDGMRLLCMTLVLFLLVDGDAVLPELAGSEFVSFK